MYRNPYKVKIRLYLDNNIFDIFEDRQITEELLGFEFDYSGEIYKEGQNIPSSKVKIKSDRKKAEKNLEVGGHINIFPATFPIEFLGQDVHDIMAKYKGTGGLSEADIRLIATASCSDCLGVILTNDEGIHRTAKRENVLCIRGQSITELAQNLSRELEHYMNKINKIKFIQNENGDKIYKAYKNDQTPVFIRISEEVIETHLRNLDETSQSQKLLEMLNNDTEKTIQKEDVSSNPNITREDGDRLDWIITKLT